MTAKKTDDTVSVSSEETDEGGPGVRKSAVKKGDDVTTAEANLEAVKAAEAVRLGPQYYIAVVPIEFNGVRVHNVGDKVPASNVIEHDWQDMVKEMD